VYSERPASDLPNRVENHVRPTTSDEISFVLYDYAYGIPPNISSSSYSEIENTPGSSANASSLPEVETAYSRELPPAPDVYDRMILPKYVNVKPDDAVSSAPDTSYCGLESSTLEPPQAPTVYETMNKPEYVNMKPDDPAFSALETSYSGLESYTREPLPEPTVYETMIKPEYVNTKPGDATSSAVETSYFGLEFSTLEPPPVPAAVYDTMIKPEYVNTKL